MCSLRRSWTLFIGNSYTHYHAMPRILSAMIRASDFQPKTSTRMQAPGGATLKQHWDQGQAARYLRERTWGWVILQELSSGPLHNLENFYTYGARFAELAKAEGAPVVLYQTWARKPGHAAYGEPWSGGSPEGMDCKLTSAYNELAVRVGAEIAPVGKAFALVREQSDLELYDEDGHHPSRLGSWLAAEVFFRTLTRHDRHLHRAPFEARVLERLQVAADEATYMSSLPVKE